MSRHSFLTLTYTVMLLLARSAIVRADDSLLVEVNSDLTRFDTDSATTFNVDLMSNLDYDTQYKVTATASGGWAFQRGDAVILASNALEDTSLEFRVIPPSANAKGDGYVIFELGVQDVVSKRTQGFDYYFANHNGVLERSTFDEYLRSIVISPDDLTSLRWQGDFSQGYASHSPVWDLKGIPEEDAKWFKQQAGEQVGDGAVVIAPLEAGAPRMDADSSDGDKVAPNRERESMGCSHGQETLPIVVMFAWGLILGTRHRRNKVLGLVLGIGVASTTSVTHAGDATAHGYIAFWDVRTAWEGQPRSSITLGTLASSRFQTCDSTETSLAPKSPNSCMPYDPHCCFSGLPYVTIQLLKSTGGTPVVVAKGSTMANGQYTIKDMNWFGAATYSLKISYQSQAASPGLISVRGQGLAGTYSLTVPLPGMTFGDNTYLIPVSLPNSGADTDIPSIYKTAIELMQYMELDGETRHHKNFGSAGPFDEIIFRYFGGATETSDCSSSTVNVGPSQARYFRPARQVGRIYHGRVVGCNPSDTTKPALPKRITGAVPIDPQQGGNGEGIALIEGIPLFMSMFWAYDPSTALHHDVRVYYASCDPDSHLLDPNGIPGTDLRAKSNDLASYINNAHALWDFLDTTTDDDAGATDQANLTLSQLMDGLFLLKMAVCGPNGCSDTNRTGAEQSFTPILGTGCVFGGTPPLYNGGTEACPSADTICNHTGDNQCYGGDPHGANLRDWIYYLPGSSAANVSTLEATLCVLPAWPGPPNNLDGFYGYRSD